MATSSIRFSHAGLHCFDLDSMVDFYSRVLGLAITDRGEIFVPGKTRIVFLSGDAGVHHQLAFVEGRTAGKEALLLNQLSFRVDSLAALRELKAKLEREGIEKFRAIDHGNAWSIYFSDPEENRVEVFVDTPWHVRQPVIERLDLALSDAKIAAATEARHKDEPEFGPIAHRRAELAKALGQQD